MSNSDVEQYSSIVLAFEQDAALYLVEMTSDYTSLSVTLEAKLILVRDRQVLITYARSHVDIGSG